MTWPISATDKPEQNLTRKELDAPVCSPVRTPPFRVGARDMRQNGKPKAAAKLREAPVAKPSGLLPVRRKSA
jgi:hypothetical protein